MSICLPHILRIARWEGRFAALFVVLWAAGCGGGGPVEIPQGDVITLVASTDDQTGPAATRLPSAFAATLTFSDGTVAPRTEVIWTIVAGNGALLSDTISVADGLGRAEASLTLGAPGTYRVRAAINADRTKTVQFVATAISGPIITNLQPTTAAAYDTITVTGSGLTDETFIEIDGVPTPTFAGMLGWRRFVMPPCLTPGSLDIVATVNGVRSNTASVSYTAPSNMIRLGTDEFRTFTATELDGCATFPGTGGGEEAWYLFAPQAAVRAETSAIPYRIQGGTPPGPATAAAHDVRDDELPLAVRFHDWLRARDREHAKLPKPFVPPSAVSAVAEVQVGHKRKFRVCSTLQCQTVAEFPEIRAEAMFVGDHAIIYIDEDAPAGGFTSADVAELGRLFDDQLYEVATTAFGSESDVDGNGRAIVLMTPIVNGLTPTTQCTESIVTGFFFSIDIDPSFRGDSRSNQAEVFYAITPDPTGVQGCRLSVAKVRRIVPLTFVHELQHMISFYQHVLVRGGSIEETWLNEAMSHLAEELAGRRFLAMGDSSSFAQFVAGDLANSYHYLEDPSMHRLLFDRDPGSLAERGAGWLFLRWIVDQYGDGTTRLLSESNRVGVLNIEAATQVPWDRLVTRWFLANYVADNPDVSAPPFLEYRSWNLRVAYAALNASDPNRFPLPFPIDPVVWSGTFSYTGSLPAGSGAYALVRLIPNDPGFVLTFTGSGGEPFTSSAPRLGVVRLRPPSTPPPNP